MQWHPLFKPWDLSIVTVESGKGRVALVFFSTELSNKDQSEISRVFLACWYQHSWHIHLKQSLAKNFFRLSRNDSSTIKTQCTSNFLHGDCLSFVEKKRCACWKCSLEQRPESQDGRNGQQTPSLATGHLDVHRGQWSRLKGLVGGENAWAGIMGIPHS